MKRITVITMLIAMLLCITSCGEDYNVDYKYYNNISPSFYAKGKDDPASYLYKNEHFVISTKGENDKVWEKGNKITKNEIQNSYSQYELIRALEFCDVANFCRALQHMDKYWPIEYLVDTPNGVDYCVYKLQEGGELFVFLEGNKISLNGNNPHLIIDAVLVKERLTFRDFSKIKPGSSYLDVAKIDSGMRTYCEIYPIQLDNLRSLHIVEGGFVKIEYTVKDEDLYLEERYGDDAEGRYKNIDNFVVKKVTKISNGGIMETSEQFKAAPNFPWEIKLYIKPEDL